jgi:hypothetical protein
MKNLEYLLEAVFSSKIWIPYHYKNLSWLVINQAHVMTKIFFFITEHALTFAEFQHQIYFYIINIHIQTFCMNRFKVCCQRFHLHMLLSCSSNSSMKFNHILMSIELHCTFFSIPSNLVNFYLFSVFAFFLFYNFYFKPVNQ